MAELDTETSEVAQQFVALGNESSVQVLAQAAAALSTVREHLAAARQALDEYAAACEQAKGSGPG
ncbi:MAG: hypothetical protein GEV10_08725 [Streptosporangiales bacterium]|nr:hypothetical protein [Streptosporangiales bacterium]